MRRLILIPLILVAALGLWLWLSGGFDDLASWAAAQQRAFQNSMARTLRGIRAGEAGAILALLSVCFGYGFFHAVGPGHGKVLIGGYGLARKVRWLRLSSISLLASLGQAVTAVVLVYAGVWLLNLSRQALIGVAEDIMAPASYGAIALIGAWLVLRGARKLARSRQAHAPHDHDHGHDHHHDHHHGHDHHHDHGHDHHHHDHDHHHHSDDEVCESCGHRHGPSLDEIEQIDSPRAALALIAGIAARPCTGAIFVLIITWQMGIPLIGIAGAFAMALGTASVTIAVGLAAIGFRGGLSGALAGSAVLARVMPLIEIAAGLSVALIALGLLLRAL